MIKKLVVRFFRLFGYEIKRLPAKRYLQRVDELSKNNQPHFIYFLGPSGVGKTTLLNKAKQNRKRPFKWITAEEFLERHVPQDEGNDKPLDVFEKLIGIKLEYLYQMRISATKRFRLFAFHDGAFETNEKVRRLNKNYSVVVDEGIFQISGSDILALFNEDKQSFDSLTENSAIIYCTSTSSRIVGQLERRKSGSAHASGTGEEELSKQLENQEKLIAVFDSWQKQFKSHGIPVLEIDTSQDMIANVRKMHAFIERLD